MRSAANSAARRSALGHRPGDLTKGGDGLAAR